MAAPPSRSASPSPGQEAVVSFLGTPAAYGARCDHVDRIDTHISIVFLADDRAFKLKRAITLPYVDYSTLERRRVCCEREVERNRRTAPALYVGAVPVTESADGTLAIRGRGTVVEWVVEMKRFAQDALLDAVADRGALDPALVAAVGHAAARLHAMATRRPDHGGAAGMRWVVDDNHAELARAVDLFDRQACEQLHTDAVAVLKRHSALLEARRVDGWVRECHGDLHLRNICLIDGRPVLFDAIEFNDELSCVDVLYDLAFLVMDLLHRDLPGHANAAVNAWMERLRQYDALPLLPFYLSCRAAIRAKVLATASMVAPDPSDTGRLRDEAQTYFERARQLLAPGSGAIVAIGGLSGAGKTTLARRLAADLGLPPGALILRSDVARKRLFGVEYEERLLPVAYEPSIGRSVYRLLGREARDIARAGYVAIVDAVLGTDEWRQEIVQAAERERVPFIGLWLDAPLEILERRLTARRGDASDATVHVLRQQRATVSPPADWVRLDAAPGVDAVAAAAMVAWSATQAGA